MMLEGLSLAMSWQLTVTMWVRVCGWCCRVVASRWARPVLPQPGGPDRSSPPGQGVPNCWRTALHVQSHQGYMHMLCLSVTDKSVTVHAGLHAYKRVYSTT